jgi:hypothetical protein
MNRIGALGLVLAAFTFNGCKKEEGPATPLTLSSLTSGTSDLTSGVANNISGLLNITATFSTSIDYASVDSTSITLTHNGNRVSLQFIVAGNAITIVPATTAGLLSGANLVLTLTNQLKSTQGLSFAGASFPFQTAGVGIDTPPGATLPSQVLYLQFNGTVEDVTGNAAVSFASLSYTTDRFGIVNGAGNFNATTTVGNGNIVEITGNYLISPSMTISVWLNIARINYLHGNRGILGLAADRGYYVEIGGDSTLPTPGPRIIREVTDHKVGPDTTDYRTSVSTYTGTDVVSDTVLFASTESPAFLLSDDWHQVVMTYDSSSYKKTFFIDGVKIEQWALQYAKGPMALNTYNVPSVLVLEQKLAIGYYCSRLNTASPAFSYSTSVNTFVGAIDDMRIFNIALTEDQVMTLYKSEVPAQ